MVLGAGLRFGADFRVGVIMVDLPVEGAGVSAGGFQFYNNRFELNSTEMTMNGTPT